MFYVEIDLFFFDLFDELEDFRESRFICWFFGLECVGDFYVVEDVFVFIIIYVELKMLEVEAWLRVGEGDVEVVLQEGVCIYIDEVIGGILDEEMDVYLDVYVILLGDMEDNLCIVLQQFYIVYFMQVEGWIGYCCMGFLEFFFNLNGENFQNFGGDILCWFIYF